VAGCGSCGKEVQDDEIARPDQDQEKGAGRNNLYAILAILLLLLGCTALLIFTGLLPNPMRDVGSTAAIVDGEKKRRTPKGPALVIEGAGAALAVPAPCLLLTTVYGRVIKINPLPLDQNINTLWIVAGSEGFPAP
jgi:hypothetical protein